MSSWFINFCAPFIPNDPTINFHRTLQVSLLLIYTLFYAAIHMYYIYWSPLPITSEPQPEQHPEAKGKDEGSSQNSQNSSQNKEVSIKLDQQPNDSCIQLKKTGSTWNQTSNVGSEKGASLIESVTLQQIQQYNSIVYGHFAIAMGLSVMYTPYAEQSLAALFYILLTIPLLAANAKRMVLTTRFFWTLMALLLVFIFTCGLLEVGQSNWDVINLDCFSNEYVPLYK